MNAANEETAPAALVPNKVLVIGDAIIDVFLDHTSTRISPEANCPVLIEKSGVAFDGGALNVLKNVRAMGAEAQFISWSEPHYKTRIMLEGFQLCRIDEPRKELPTVTQERWRELQELMDSADVVVLSDYGLGALDFPHILIDMALRKQKPVLVDPYKGKADWSIYDGATVVKCNSSEMMDHPSIINVGGFVITMGAEGCAVADAHRKVLRHFPAHSITPLDVTGAGDTFMACLATFWNRTASHAVLIELCNRAAALAVAKPMTAVVTKEELFND